MKAGCALAVLLALAACGGGEPVESSASVATPASEGAAPSQAHALGVRETLSLQLVPAGHGRTLALWSESHRGRVRLMAAEADAGQPWRAPVVVDAPEAAHALEARLGVDGQGRAIAVWTRVEEGRRSVWTSRQPGPRLPWDSPQCLHVSPPEVSTSPQPRLAVAPDGQAIAAWLQADAAVPHDDTGVWATRFSPAQRWSAAQRLDVQPAPVHTAPSVAFDEGGTAIVRWIESDRLEGGAQTHWEAAHAASTGWQPAKAAP